MYYKLPLIFEPQPEGGYTVTSPLLPELLTEGDTLADALDSLRTRSRPCLRSTRSKVGLSLPTSQTRPRPMPSGWRWSWPSHEVSRGGTKALNAGVPGIAANW